MAKDPAFLFYSSDFLAGIQDLTMEERGQYITLLSLQHQKGHLSEKIIKLSVGNAAADVMAKFRQDSAGLWYNPRLDLEKEKRQAHSKKQSERAKEGWKKRKTNTTADAAALPLEDVNENEIENEVSSKKEITAELFSDEIWVEQMSMTHRGKDLRQAWDECYLHHSADPLSKKFQLWQWRQKLNSWLTLKRKDVKKQTVNPGKIQ